MIKKCVIANRGEIASRIIRTCHKLGVTAVAVYSEADRNAPFVSLADESYFIGPSRVQESYLNAGKIISVAKESHADAIHPGYGFLSENAVFADKCEKAGIRFIGPSAQIIEKMGDKIAARDAMEKAGVPVVPGTDGTVQSTEEAVHAARDIGYPVMLKASAGGGGIGMQAVYSEDALAEAFENNSKRASTLFGNGAMFMEKKLDNARHIEIQLLADSYGNAVYLFERECSIQRRNQKVIEEAPSPFLSDRTRQRMGEAAVKAAEKLGYTSAGTIEFMVDAEENFYFLEMNTRIQVEHPVTEEITGVDMVEQQILIAEGRQIPFTQSSITRNGHAIEARIYAEDPNTFLPSPGHIYEFKPPEGSKIRHELAVASDIDVTPFYDPMIAKLIAKGSNRQEAIQSLHEALNDYYVSGIQTNIPMLIEILNHEQFTKGNTTTAFVENYYTANKKSSER